jgi:hypothetical protein
LIATVATTARSEMPNASATATGRSGPTLRHGCNRRGQHRASPRPEAEARAHQAARLIGVLARAAIYRGRQSGELGRPGQRILDLSKRLLGLGVLPMPEAGPHAIDEPADGRQAALGHLLSGLLRGLQGQGRHHRAHREGHRFHLVTSSRREPRPPPTPAWIRARRTGGGGGIIAGRARIWPMRRENAPKLGRRELAERLRPRHPERFLSGGRDDPR